MVRHVDIFYGRVDIDFDRKPGHQMSLAYAAEALQLLDDEHLLVRIHRDRAAMAKMAQDDAGQVVRMALQSFGPMNVAQLQELLSPRLVSADDWKRFWDAARKVLKKDHLVEIPSKRTDPLRLLSKKKAYDREWFAMLAQERDMASVLSLVDELVENKTSIPDDECRRIIGERLAFVIKGAGHRTPALTAQAYMAAREVGADAGLVNVAAGAAELMGDGLFLETTRTLPARLVGPFILFLSAYDAARLSELLMRLLRRLGMTALNEAVAYLLANGREEAVAAAFREAVTAQEIEVEFLYWIVRNPEKRDAWGLGTLSSLMRLILLDLARSYSGDRLKVKNMLRSRVEHVDFLREAMAGMTDLQREEVIQLVRESSAWSALDRQSVLGHIVKLYPELEAVVASRAGSSAAPAAPARARLTSQRSYTERQKLLEKVVTVDIPQNSKEIAIARSYGDLSENHEFKAAKEMQGILLKRRGDLEEMLHAVKPTDFAGASTEAVGPGTGVVLEYKDGRRERYHILGEWDQDAALGIISSETRMAQVLAGRRAGDEVRVPAETGEADCRIAEVTPLPEEVRKWVAGE
ncbi:MAG: Transcription elongation factor GreA [Verrucomicrobia bacterium ADurb.Bin345]|nr:MAG: Transcription elongation factor GreA [Verrucomicrobia bacterium ADurb.Bin345]